MSYIEKTTGMRSSATHCVGFALTLLLGPTSLTSQVDTLISYDVRTREIQIIVPTLVPNTSFDHTPWNYGSEPGFTNLSLVPPVNTFPGAGFTDYQPAQFSKSVADFPARTSVKLFRFHGDTLTQQCSGTMISKDLVLTSSHCLYAPFDSSNVLRFADSILAVPAFDNAMENPVFGSSISQVYYFPKINLTNYWLRDIAIIRLREPIGLKTGWIGISFAIADSFYQNNVFHKFSYPGRPDVTDSTRVFNGDTLYYNYGLLDLIDQSMIGYDIPGVPGQSGSSLFYTDNTQYHASGTLSFSIESQHTRITRGLFYSFKTVVDQSNTGIEGSNLVPSRYILENPFPNPFNPTTTVSVALPMSGLVSLEVYDLLGRHVAVLHKGDLSAGVHSFVFNGDGLPSGVYIVHLAANDFSTSKNVILVK